MGKEYPNTDRILALSALLFFVVWILDFFIFKCSERYANIVPDVVKVLLFACTEISAVLLGYYSHEALYGKKHDEFKLIADGPFAYVRHPLYLSILLTYLGFIFSSISIVSAIPWICYCFLFDRMATYEEEDLIRIFGEEYAMYRKTVPKWIPRLAKLE